MTTKLSGVTNFLCEKTKSFQKFDARSERYEMTNEESYFCDNIKLCKFETFPDRTLSLSILLTLCHCSNKLTGQSLTSTGASLASTNTIQGFGSGWVFSTPYSTLSFVKPFVKSLSWVISNYNYKRFICTLYYVYGQHIFCQVRLPIIWSCFPLYLSSMNEDSSSIY